MKLYFSRNLNPRLTVAAARLLKSLERTPIIPYHIRRL